MCQLTFALYLDNRFYEQTKTLLLEGQLKMLFITLLHFKVIRTVNKNTSNNSNTI